VSENVRYCSSESATPPSGWPVCRRRLPSSWSRLGRRRVNVGSTKLGEMSAFSPRNSPTETSCRKVHSPTHGTCVHRPRYMTATARCHRDGARRTDRQLSVITGILANVKLGLVGQGLSRWRSIVAHPKRLRCARSRSLPTADRPRSAADSGSVRSSHGRWPAPGRARFPLPTAKHKRMARTVASMADKNGSCHPGTAGGTPTRTYGGVGGAVS
jgi:hypothetical protein